jgi:hypothetical protein
MNTEQLDYLRGNTKELVLDLPRVNWLLKLDSHYLKEIANNLELTSEKNRETYFFINYLIKTRYEN